MSQLCALADVKSYLGITSTTQDALITTLIGNASAFIERFCGRIFEQATYTETRNGNNASAIFCRQTPIISVTSVTIDGIAVPEAPDATSYGFVYDDHIVYLRGDAPMRLPGVPSSRGYPRSFCRGVQNVVLVYEAGYATIPADLNQACVELIASKLAKRERIDKKSETLGQQQTVSFDLSDMPASVKTVLMQYLVTMVAP